MQLLSRLRRDQRGFTLVELLAAMIVAMVVLFGVLGLLDATIRSSARSTGRVQGVREGRTTMDRISQELHLASCPADGPAVLSGDANAVSYFVSRPQADYTLDDLMERHTLTFSGGRVVLTITGGSGSPIVWDATPSRTSVIGTGLTSVTGQPFFQYLGYTTPSDPGTSPLTAPLATADLSQAAQVRVQFNAVPSFGSTSAQSTFDSTVTLRTDDPTDEDNTPQC
jgi:prepilin-type N-terminal cleavage/methylation domain-containing protein